MLVLAIGDRPWQPALKRSQGTPIETLADKVTLTRGSDKATLS
jgi:hypothetical protein